MTLLGEKATYIIKIDKAIFNIKFEYIRIVDIYESIAYILPIKLDKVSLIIFISIFNITADANRII